MVKHGSTGVRSNGKFFFDTVLWGDPSCPAKPAAHHVCMGFMSFSTLSAILNQIADHASKGHAPRQECSRSSIPTAEFILTGRSGVVLERLTAPEIEPISSTSAGSAEYPISHLQQTSLLADGQFPEFGTKLLTTSTPRLWARQQRENTVKNPCHVILTIMMMLVYSRSHDCCLLKMLWSIYLKACGLSARAFDALHMLGLTMSHKWTANVFAQIAQAAAAARRRAIKERSHFGSHDNLNFPMRVHAQCRKGLQEPFFLIDLSTDERDASFRIAAQARHRILRFLPESPQFKAYPNHDHPALAAPPPTTLLPCGPDHITEQPPTPTFWLTCSTLEQHILETVEVDESSYEGTDRLCNNIWLEQMGYGSEEEKRRTGWDRLFVWVSDHLTVDRIRGLARYQHGDPNAFTRMELLEPVFGWFHTLMAFANSLHAQYIGRSAGISLRKAFETLGRKGLLKTETKGVLWHHLNEALWHIGEVSFQALALEVAGVDDLEALAQFGPDELLAVVHKIYEHHLSREAVSKIEALPASERDEQKRQMVLFSTDMLSYFDLREAMRIGEVGRMENLLPTMLFWFAGGCNPKYAIEILELLQKLRSEWPVELRDHVRRYCWLINLTGSRDGFMAVDMAQEHNIKDIKISNGSRHVTWRSFRPGATFLYVQKVSPAIPVLCAVEANVAYQFPAIVARGTRHGSPEKANDVSRLRDMYVASKAHKSEHGRSIP
ncbi:hypothetical protein FKP32DRAFT_1613962 [Trametes sanguinea]|nr:hypothetical protein FKP32DRAFT_1613962 [Trametes sanguinea]